MKCLHGKSNDVRLLDQRKEKFRDPQTRLELDRAMAESKPILSFSCRWDLLAIKKAARPET